MLRRNAAKLGPEPQTDNMQLLIERCGARQAYRASQTGE